MSNEKTKAMRLADCPPGLFFWNGTLGFKSDYGMMERSIPEGKTWTVGKRPDAYCADTGEIFWGGTQTHEERSEVLVYPVDAAALSPEAPAREVCDLEGLLTTALTDELQDGGAEVPYSIIAERVAARVADEASAPSCALTVAAEEALSFLQNAPLESGICCCGDPISGHGYGSGHPPVDDLAYHSSQVAEKLQAALTPRHEAPASDDVCEAAK